MFVIPVDDGLPKKFPVVTLCIILLTCLVFFGFQLHEDEGYEDALAFSQASGLLQIEAVAYLDFLKTNNRELPAEFKNEQRSAAFFWHMMQDDRFQYDLRRAALITPSDPGYTHWQELRQIFEADLDRVFSRNKGYAPARNNYGALFTAMFLHTNFIHLLLNMVLLWFVGSLLEIGVGRIALAGYGLAGFCGSLLFGLVFSIGQGPLVGASGAIAGLMGMYGVLYSRVSLRASHSLWFSFDYAPVPGWILLPFWLVSEIVQICTSFGSSGAYVAHIGGLLVGVGLGVSYVAKRSDGSFSNVVEKKVVNKVDVLLEKIEWALAVQRRGEARATVFELLEIEPENTVARIHLFNIDKSEPESQEFHSTASLLLGHLVKKRRNVEIEKYFEEYLALCPSAKVQPDVLLGVTTSYIHSGKTEPASKLLALILKLDPENAGLPAGLFNLAQIYRAGNKQKEAKHCLRILCAHYPETNSGLKAKDLLSPQLHHTFGNDG